MHPVSRQLVRDVERQIERQLVHGSSDHVHVTLRKEAARELLERLRGDGRTITIPLEISAEQIALEASRMAEVPRKTGYMR